MITIIRMTQRWWWSKKLNPIILNRGMKSYQTELSSLAEYSG